MQSIISTKQEFTNRCLRARDQRWRGSIKIVDVEEIQSYSYSEGILFCKQLPLQVLWPCCTYFLPGVNNIYIYRQGDKAREGSNLSCKLPPPSPASVSSEDPITELAVRA